MTEKGKGEKKSARKTPIKKTLTFAKTRRNIEFILQGATPVRHSDVLKNISSRLKPEMILFSVGFVNISGIEEIEGILKPLAKGARCYLGIRNGITSIQAVNRLIDMKVDVFAVDTGMRNIIYHPKVYLLAKKDVAKLVIGSANLTFNGLNNNIEASAVITLDMNDRDDRETLASVVRQFQELEKDHPEHVKRIKKKDAQKLFEAGILIDESEITAPTPAGQASKGKRDSDTVPRMKLHRKTKVRKLKKVGKLKAKKAVKKKPKTKAARIIGTAKHSPRYSLVWESKELTERDLNIPSGSGTHATGSMGLKKGKMEDIDQRHYFRDDVFSELIWRPDPSKANREIAEVQCEVVIKNISYGNHTFTLSHNTDTSSVTYQQKNFMTHLRWGEAKPLIAKRDLLGRTISIYRKEGDPPEFKIEID